MSHRQNVLLDRVTWSPRIQLAAAAVAAALVLGGYLLGAQRTGQTTVERGHAYVGAAIAGAQVDGYAYGFQLDLPWQGVDGITHERGRPDCLSEVGSTVEIEFGWVDAVGPEGGGTTRHVVWVRCL